MIKSLFFNLGAKPTLPYPVLGPVNRDALQDIPLPREAVLLHRILDSGPGGLVVKVGDKVRTGQRLLGAGSGDGVLISTVTGTVVGISSQKGYLGSTESSVRIRVSESEEWDEEFGKFSWEPSAQGLPDFLGLLPGASALASAVRREPPVGVFVVMGVDQDLLVSTNQFLLKTELEAVREGVELLRRIAGNPSVLIVVPPDLIPYAEKTGAEVRTIRPFYPSALPRLVMKEVLGRIVPAEMEPEDMGVTFVGVETLLALREAVEKGCVPVHKVLTVFKKDMTAVHIRARIGTPVRDVLDALGIETAHGDRVILGGLMTGQAMFREDTPVSRGTDAILVQDKERVVPASDTHCINCGECVRACPAGVPVNMLIRLLENGLYREAADLYDLLSCVDCGLCSYVCVARIPVFQYITLGKYEFARKKIAEVGHA